MERQPAILPEMEIWEPEDYDPGLTVQAWIELLNDREVFDKKSLEIVARIKHYGGQATCLQLEKCYGESRHFYNFGSVHLAKKIAKVTGCPVMGAHIGRSKWWSILYIGRPARKDEQGTFTWRLRDELSEALDTIDLSRVQLYAAAATDGDEKSTMAPVSQTRLDMYTKEDFLQEVYMPEHRYEQVVRLLERKKNIILQGAPGVGKTFAAKRLAYSMMGECDDSRVAMVQFHQNYSYEDFVMGYKPTGDGGFELQHGIFYRFCQQASADPERNYFFIVDEINRGNVSKIFGELLMLIEEGYRGVAMPLAYGGEQFQVPENLYIIGMMNTADRSLAIIDYALRRRFGFVYMEPAFDTEKFATYQRGLHNTTFDRFIAAIRQLNAAISQDDSLGKGFCMGHSHVCGRRAETCTDEWMRSVAEFDIIPTLDEYWFDEPEKVRHWENVFSEVLR